VEKTRRYRFAERLAAMIDHLIALIGSTRTDDQYAAPLVKNFEPVTFISGAPSETQTTSQDDWDSVALGPS
jgi:hypothetical protein